MTKEQAVMILQKRIWQPEAVTGICGSRGFWYDTSSNMLVHVDKISMLAHKRGKQLKKLSHSFNDVVVFEKQYYIYDFIFNEVNLINIIKDPRLLPGFPRCNKKDITDDYLIIDFYIDKLNSMKFIVLDNVFDETMAAIDLLFPLKPVKIK